MDDVDDAEYKQALKTVGNPRSQITKGQELRAARARLGMTQTD